MLGGWSLVVALHPSYEEAAALVSMWIETPRLLQPSESLRAPFKSQRYYSEIWMCLEKSLNDQLILLKKQATCRVDKHS